MTTTMVTILLITAMLCFVAVIYIIKLFEYKNPYVDEIIGETSYTRTLSEGGYQSETHYVVRRYKRTYKNGKVIFFTNQEK